MKTLVLINPWDQFRRAAAMTCLALLILAMLLLAMLPVMEAHAAPGAGAVTITPGTQGSTLTYGTAASADFLINVAQAGQTSTSITLSVSGLPGGATAQWIPGNSVAGTRSPGVNTTLRVTTTGDHGGTPAGTYFLTISNNIDANSGTATLTVGKNPLTVSATASNKTYDASPAAVVNLTDNRITGDVFTVNYSGAAFSDENVGTGKTVTVSGIIITGTDAGNYTVNPSATTTARIFARDLTVSATGIDKTYDGSTAATVTLSDNRMTGDVLTTAYTAAAFGTKDVGSPKSISVTGISIGGTDAVNYNLLNTTATASANIAVRALTVSATGINKTYDGTTAAAVTLSDNRLPGDIFTDSYTGATFDDPNVGNTRTVSVAGISISGTDAGNYSFNTTAAASADIGMASSSVTVTCPSSPETYTGAAIAPCTASYSGAGGLTGSLTPTYSANVNVGTVTANATYAGDGNHTGSSNSSTFEVGKASSSVTVTCPAETQTYAGSAIEPCTASYAGVGGLTGSLTPTYLANVNVGTATANATYAGDGNHTGSGNSSTFQIGKADAVIHVTPYSATYDGTQHTATGTAKGVLDEDLAGLALNGTAHTDAGTYSTDAWTFTDVTGNYNDAGGTVTDVISKATADIHVTAYAETYTGSAFTATGTALGIESVPADLSDLLDLSGTSHTDAGSYNGDTWNFAGNGNYLNANGSVDDSIGKAPSTVTVTCPTSESYTGSAITPCTAAATGNGMSAVDVTASILYSNNTELGTATVDASWDGDSNHFGNTGSGSFEIGVASSATVVTVGDAVYDGSTHGGSAAVTGAGGLSESLTVSYAGRNTTTYAASETAPTDVGEYTASATFAGDTHHTGSTDSKDFTITKASSTVTVTCPTSQTFTGAALTPCTAAATGDGMTAVDVTASMLYSNNTAMGTATADASWDGDSNHFGDTGSSTFEITGNTAPSFTSTPVTLAAVGSLYSYSITTTDADSGDTLAITAPVLPLWLTFTDNGDGTASLTGTPAVTDMGTQTVTLQVSDGVNTAAEQSFTLNPSRRLVLNSNKTYDGYVLELGRLGSIGGTMNPTAKVIVLGDDALNQQYRAVLSFNTTLPSTATITRVTLRIKQSGAVTGANPFTALGKLLVDVKKGNFSKAVLQLTDWQSKPTKSAAMSIPAARDTSGWNSANLGGTLYTLINRAGNTQFRLRFAKADNGNSAPNLIRFFSGNAAVTVQPQLIIEYSLP